MTKNQKEYMLRAPIRARMAAVHLRLAAVADDPRPDLVSAKERLLGAMADINAALEGLEK